MPTLRAPNTLSLLVNASRTALVHGLHRQFGVRTVELVEADPTSEALVVAVTTGLRDEQWPDVAFEISAYLSPLWHPRTLDAAPGWWPVLEVSVNSRVWSVPWATMRRLAEQECPRAEWQSAVR